MFNQELSENIIDAGVIHLGDNISGHSPIYLKLKTGSLPKITLDERVFSEKQNWNKATEKDNESFKSEVKINLSNIDIPDCIDNCEDLL